LRLAGPLGGNVLVDRRNRHPLVPAGSGAKASLACEDRRLVRVCPRVESVAEIDGRHQGPEKRVTPLANGRVDGGPGGAISPRGEIRGAPKVSASGAAVAKPQRRTCPEPGA